MPKTIIIGTVALDTIETPFGKVDNALGGSATYASYSASFFIEPAIVSIVGEDFPEKYLNVLKSKNICIKGIKKKGKTFRWEGSYEFDMNEAKTLKTELNALEEFDAELPEDYKEAEFVFLGNIDPDLQIKVVEQLKNPKLIAMDTMNFWIDTKKKKLLEVIKKVDVLLINDAEARQLFETVNLMAAANKALALGPKAVIIKKGEHGALLYTKNKHFNAPGYPLEVIKDPTGCGDTFGGAFVGYLAKENNIDEMTLRRAIIHGSVLASFNAEDFSLERMKLLKESEIHKRVEEFREMKEF